MNDPVGCAVCGASDAADHLQINLYRLRRCLGCGLLATYPPPARDQLASLYQEEYYGGREASRFKLQLGERVMQWFRRSRARRIRRLLQATKGRVLDVGCGRGYTLRSLKGWGFEVYGTQISAAAARFARERLGLTSVFHGDLHEAAYPDGWFDFITLYHVLEHLPDPLLHMRELHRILKPGALLYIEVPNAASLPARWLGAYWLAWDVPRHLFHYDPLTLTELGKRCGLTPVRSTFFSLEYSPATLLFSLVSIVFGDNNFLFRYLTGDPVGRRSGHRPAALAAMATCEAAVGAVLLLPILVLSVGLAWMRAGDTFGIYFQKLPRSTAERYMNEVQTGHEASAKREEQAFAARRLLAGIKAETQKGLSPLAGGGSSGGGPEGWALTAFSCWRGCPPRSAWRRQARQQLMISAWRFRAMGGVSHLGPSRARSASGTVWA